MLSMMTTLAADTGKEFNVPLTAMQKLHNTSGFRMHFQSIFHLVDSFCRQICWHYVANLLLVTTTWNQEAGGCSGPRIGTVLQQLTEPTQRSAWSNSGNPIANWISHVLVWTTWTLFLPMLTVLKLKVWVLTNMPRASLKGTTLTVPSTSNVTTLLVLHRQQLYSHLCSDHFRRWHVAYILWCFGAQQEFYFSAGL